MNKRTKMMLFALIKSAICGNQLSDKEKEMYSAEMLPQMMKIAKHHDVIHLLTLGLKKNNLLDGDGQELEKAVFLANYRYEQMNFELVKLCEALEKAQTPFILLKGSVIREYYPEPWMRTSCDIDVLVHEDDLQKATDYLINNLGYKFNHKFTHDVSLFTKSGYHIELHYSLMEDEPIKSSAAVLNDVWDFVSKCNGYECRYELPDAVFYFYHIAHMAKHFENGGCGIRPFIDLWILENIQEGNKEKRDELLHQGDLLEFTEAARKLSRIWFGNEGYDSVTEQMEDYILRGGVYGNNENRIIVQQQKSGGRFKYLLSKFFLPYEMLKFYYPILEKHRWLTPIMQVRRWCRLILGGQLMRTTKELHYNSNITNTEAENMQNFLRSIGL